MMTWGKRVHLQCKVSFVWISQEWMVIQCYSDASNGPTGHGELGWVNPAGCTFGAQLTHTGCEFWETDDRGDGFHLAKTMGCPTSSIWF